MGESCNARNLINYLIKLFLEYFMKMCCDYLDLIILLSGEIILEI